MILESLLDILTDQKFIENKAPLDRSNFETCAQNCRINLDGNRSITLYIFLTINREIKLKVYSALLEPFHRTEIHSLEQFSRRKRGRARN